MLLLAVGGDDHAGASSQLVEGEGLPQPGRRARRLRRHLEHLSLAVAVVLIVTYAAGPALLAADPRDLFNPHEDESTTEDRGGWSTRRSVIALAIAGVAVGVMSEILVGSIEEASQAIGSREFFIGAIVVAIVGNAAEHWVAVLVAYKNKMNLAVNIAIGSSAQIALFVAPVLVLCSFFLGPHPMPLVFNGFELARPRDRGDDRQPGHQEGESTWYEGFQLLPSTVLGSPSASRSLELGIPADWSSWLVGLERAQGVITLLVGEHRPVAADPLQLARARPGHDRAGVGTPSGPISPVCWKTKVRRPAGERPGDPVVADVAAAAFRLGDHQLGRALALQIAAEGPRDVDAAELDAVCLGVGILVVAVVGEGRRGLHTSCPSASSTTSSWVFGEALGITWATLPSGSMMKVARCTPM